MLENFSLPLDFSRLENDRFKIVPIEKNIDEWMEAYVQDGLENPQVYDYLTGGPYNSGAECVAMYQGHFSQSTTDLLLAVVLKAGMVTRKDAVTGEETSFEVADGTFAGISGMEGHPARATAGLGLMLLTKFHRTFVSTHVHGLMLHYLLDGPADGGLGLRRVQWKCNASNKASVNTAKRVGFQWEGVTRWEQVLPPGKAGSEGAELDKKGLPKTGWDGRAWAAGRHTANLSLCWDDWLNGGRDHVDALMKR